MTTFRLPAWYRFPGSAAAPFARLIAPERFGPWIRREGRPVWIHAASLGELKASVRLAHALPPNTPCFLTATTTAGWRKLRRELPDRPSALLPFDELRTIRRFLDAVAPRCAVFLEAEAWPAAFHELSSRRIPLALAAFRSSSDSLRRWRRFGRLFPGWTSGVGALWTDGSNPTEIVRELGFAQVRPGTSLKWAGATPRAPHSHAHLGAALSIHLRDLPAILRLRHLHPTGWLWFPRRLGLRLPLVWFARSVGAKVVREPQPGPGEIWIAPEFGLVRELLPSCRVAWVSPGHDTEEPFHLGAAHVLTGNPAVRVESTVPGAAATLRELLDWIPSA